MIPAFFASWSKFKHRVIAPHFAFVVSTFDFLHMFLRYSEIECISTTFTKKSRESTAFVCFSF